MSNGGASIQSAVSASVNNEQLILPKKLFNCKEIKSRIHEILHASLHDKEYNSDECVCLAKNISGLVKDLLKSMGYDRYKFVVQVVIGEERSDSLQMACRSYWDPHSDSFAQSIYINQFFLCVCTAFAVYYY
ncbi:unnamed protein product [Didymodactylos carnosus]|uniref:Tctex1 domain-containing protein 2 n=1 Tax=Didymodactylos carnosus TaxID=1234261 RepID=A0A814C3D1_9BILA|nr:unnamed protein product [Didymodactylos carnosus]CAF1378262.1 unnamed protein product [Didymodactylos carnosus]CAF3712320.1 unnamed protein product [Didymodactylos carnosus]CAF4186951.1 unnamed protein product [Didymodactylos carnosus]